MSMEEQHKAHLRQMNPEQMRTEYHRMLGYQAADPAHRAGWEAAIQDVRDVALERGIALELVSERTGAASPGGEPHGERADTVWGPVPIGTGA